MASSTPQPLSGVVTGASQLSTSAQQSRQASAPFDRDDADLILRSSDNIDFHVHRVILTLASPVLAGMFSIPQPPVIGSGRPVVNVSEDGEALDVLLRICYPEPPDPRLKSLDLICRVLGAAMKYKMKAATVLAKNVIFKPRHLDSCPLKVFVIACRLGLEAEASIAAHRAIDMGKVDDLCCPELDDISAGAYYRLLELKRARAQPQKPSHMRIGNKPSSITIIAPGPFCELAPRHETSARNPLSAVRPPFDAPDAHLILRSSDGVDFRVSRSNVASASARTLLERTIPSKLCEDASGLAIHLMEEDSVVVDTMLRMCCATSSAPLDDLDLLFDVLFAARKYDLQAVDVTIRSSWPTILEKDPLRAYIHAVRYGWEVEARNCVRSLLQNHSLSSTYARYLPEFETMQNGPYRRLLGYLQACSQAATLPANFRLNIKEAPKRSCSTWLPCYSRYPHILCINIDPEPEDFSVLSKPMLLALQSIHHALKDRPCKSTLSSNTEVVRKFLQAAVNDIPPCRDPDFHPFYKGKPPPIPRDAQPCSPQTNLTWAWALLDSYATVVDDAVSKVPEFL
ncbi:hypothetical protein VTO73DRAFT_7407 [Trametes versicolor]